MSFDRGPIEYKCSCGKTHTIHPGSTIQCGAAGRSIDYETALKSAQVANSMSCPHCGEKVILGKAPK